MSRPKSCTCEHYKAKEPHEYTCNMNINQHAKVKEPNNMRSLENATERPWRYTRNDVKKEYGVHHDNIFIRSGEKVVCEVWEENEANARLIASAPELLEALKRIMRSNAVECAYKGETSILCYCDDYKAPEKCEFCNAMAAIARAEGRA